MVTLSGMDYNTTKIQLESELKTVIDWFSANKLKINVTKTQYIIFGNDKALKKVPENTTLTLNGEEIVRGHVV